MKVAVIGGGGGHMISSFTRTLKHNARIGEEIKVTEDNGKKENLTDESNGNIINTIADGMLTTVAIGKGLEYIDESFEHKVKASKEPSAEAPAKSR